MYSTFHPCIIHNPKGSRKGCYDSRPIHYTLIQSLYKTQLGIRAATKSSFTLLDYCSVVSSRPLHSSASIFIQPFIQPFLPHLSVCLSLSLDNGQPRTSTWCWCCSNLSILFSGCYCQHSSYELFSRYHEQVCHHSSF